MCWGAFQGGVLVVGRAIEARAKRVGASLGRGLNWRRLLLGVVMFHVTCYGWLLFRAESIHQAAAFTRLLFTNLSPAANTLESLAIPFAQIVAPFLAVHIYQAMKGSELAVVNLPMPVRYAVYGLVFYLVLLFGDFSGAQFIYFQF